MRKQLFFSLFWLLGAAQLFATHNRAGEIVFTKLGGLKVQVSIITVTKASSVNADRDSLTIAWGDGATLTAPRINGSGELLGNDRKKNIYMAVYEYAAAGVYMISVTDPNRNAGILNVNAPNSELVPFFLEAMLRLTPDAAGSTHSPVFLQLPVDDAVVFQPYTHIPNAFDPDGDSLAYELVSPMQAEADPVPNYLLPDQIAPGDDNKISFDPVTGAFNWNTPILPGAYNIAILVKSYHNGVLVETTLRDVTIDVSGYNNNPPELVLSSAFPSDGVAQVFIGQTVVVNLQSSDPDAGQTVALTASGGPLDWSFQEKATFSSSGDQGVFTWYIDQEYLRNEPYQMVFKAKDDYLGGLATFRVMRFKVLAPVGVGEVSEDAGIQLAPNPATETTLVRFNSPLEQDMDLNLLDMSGRMVRSLHLSAGEQARDLSLTGLPPGTYRVSVQDKDGSWRGLNVVKR